MTDAEILAARLAAYLRLMAKETPPTVLNSPALTLPWSPLARMVIAINIDRSTPGGIR